MEIVDNKRNSYTCISIKDGLYGAVTLNNELIVQFLTISVTNEVVFSSRTFNIVLIELFV